MRLRFLGASSLGPSGVGAGETLRLGTCQCGLLHQNALALVAPAGPTESHDHGAQATVLPRPPGERSIAGGQEHEVIQAGAGHAGGPAILHLEEPT